MWTFTYGAGMDWHPNMHMDENLITRGDLPRFIMDSYEECRGPPRLFLLDKYNIVLSNLSSITFPRRDKPPNRKNLICSKV